MITSLDNKKVKDWTKLHQKKYRGEEYLLLSERLVFEAYQNSYLKTLIYVGDKPFEFDNAFDVNQEVMDKISKSKGLKYIGVGKFINEKRDYKNRVMILDDLQDPLNIGRVMESAYLFGFDSIILSKNSADIYHEKCLTASNGAIYKLNIYRGDIIEEIKGLKQMEFGIYATGLRDNTKFLKEVETINKMAFVLGNEGSGVSKEVFDIADETVKIDMHNIDSLNVAMAGSIVMYAFKV